MLSAPLLKVTNFQWFNTKNPVACKKLKFEHPLAKCTSKQNLGSTSTRAGIHASDEKKTLGKMAPRWSFFMAVRKISGVGALEFAVHAGGADPAIPDELLVFAATASRLALGRQGIKGAPERKIIAIRQKTILKLQTPYEDFRKEPKITSRSSRVRSRYPFSFFCSLL